MKKTFFKAALATATLLTTACSSFKNLQSSDIDPISLEGKRAFVLYYGFKNAHDFEYEELTDNCDELKTGQEYRCECEANDAREAFDDVYRIIQMGKFEEACLVVVDSSGNSIMQIHFEHDKRAPGGVKTKSNWMVPGAPTRGNRNVEGVSMRDSRQGPVRDSDQGPEFK
ncbi:MAG: hypothetical protein KDJ35_08135 [Alphaproteobacteria bacterium]|nr:hypothetical protein [Alphaproteobacteria bacterium]